MLEKSYKNAPSYICNLVANALQLNHFGKISLHISVFQYQNNVNCFLIQVSIFQTIVVIFRICSY